MTSEAVDSLSCYAEVFYRRLMSVVDDYGRYYAKPALLRAACYPLRLEKVTDIEVVKYLAEICNTKPGPLALVYEDRGKQYLQLFNFKQQVRTNAKFPAPPDGLSESTITTVPSDITRRDSAHLGGGVVGYVVVGEGVLPAKAGSGNPKVSPPACPHEKIIDAYHRRLPMGRQIKVKLWNGTRAKHLQARWREDEERQTVEWWDKFFGYCAQSQFLTGRAPPKAGRSPFEISLDWLIEPSNFAKVMEGAYER